jgi:hypothetical protein
MNAPVNSRSIDIPTEFQSCFDTQRAAYLAAPEPSYDQRIADLKALAQLLKDNKDELVAAINADYGSRAEFETLFAEYFVVLETIADARKNLKKWMKPQRRHIDFTTYPLARNRVIPQPLGVVGVIVPWNFPLNLSFCPLAAGRAEGTRRCHPFLGQRSRQRRHRRAAAGQRTGLKHAYAATSFRSTARNRMLRLPASEVPTHSAPSPETWRPLDLMSAFGGILLQ